MDSGLCSSEKQRGSEEEEEEEEIDQLRKGPWTVEEDLVLMNYIAIHGEGRWNALAHCAGTTKLIRPALSSATYSSINIHIY